MQHWWRTLKVHHKHDPHQWPFLLWWSVDFTCTSEVFGSYESLSHLNNDILYYLEKVPWLILSNKARHEDHNPQKLTIFSSLGEPLTLSKIVPHLALIACHVNNLVFVVGQLTTKYEGNMCTLKSKLRHKF